MKQRKMFSYLTRFAITCAVLFLFGSCEKKEEVDPPGNTEDVTKYLQELPSWNQFSPSGEPQPPTPQGEPEPLEDVVLDVEVINEDGSITLLEDVTYSCQSQPFTLAANPQQIAMYSPDREILYAGALIQGKSHRDGLGS
ncbi:MAG: hypothetical protein EA361_04855, partial [Bacteroidetes bacterium]